MNQEQKQKVIDLLNSINLIPKNNRNRTQKDLMKIFKEDNQQWDDIWILLNNTELYINTNLEPLNFEEGEFNLQEIKDDPEFDIEVSTIDAPISKNGTTSNGKIKSKNIIYYDVVLNVEALDILINLRNPNEPVPTDVFKFITQIDKVKNVILELYEGKELTSNLRSLAGITRVGGTSSYTSLANMHLKQLKDEIVLRKGNKIKYSYLKELGIYSFVFVLICLIIYSLPNIPKLGVYDYLKSNYITHGLFIVIGASIGAWLSFAIRKKEIAFEDLRTLNENKKSPLILLIIIILISLCFYLMFITKFLNIKIGDIFDTYLLINDDDHKKLALLVGIFFGLSENTIGPKLTSRVESFISKV